VELQCAVSGRKAEEYFMRLLLPIDGSEFSEAALDEVANRPWPEGSEVRIITAAEIPMIIGLEPWAAAPIYFEQFEGAVRDSASALVENAVTKLKSKGTPLRISCAVLVGSPREMIVEEADRWGADLIVMGSRGLGAWSRLLIGSVSSAVLHHAKCSVEIVRKRETNGN
jgi:nucleotide-binding universal stress UspA family protein